LAEKKEQQFHYGGQAVIEGVMMRGPKDFAVAVRKADGEVVTTVEDVEGIMGRFKWLNKPFLRGTLAMIDSMALGIKALKYSADIAMADVADAPSSPKSDAVEAAPAAQPSPEPAPAPAAKSPVSEITVSIIMVLGLVLGVALFMLVPIVITKPLKSVVHVSWQLTAIEGAIKIGLFVGYVMLISLMKDIRRVFQYHGAEHKVINAYEAGVTLTVDNVVKYTKAHVRCGTSFILVVLVSSIVVFALVADHLPHGSLTDKSMISYLARWLYKLALLPFVAGLAYEVIRFAGRHKDSVFTRLLTWPGLLMQRITTREPDPEMIEVAIRSLECVFEKEAAQAQDAPAAAS